MKIRVKGFKSLIKAVQNRAHLFPVKVLVNGKTKTYYSIRYKTGNKAMEIAKKQMKIPNNVEALFDTKDGKRKNLSENDVLRIYDKAGKPGSLQEFIEKNFKKPYVKPRNSTTVDLEQQQMSIDDLMQGNKNKTKEKELSLIELAEQKAQKLKETGQAVDPRIGNTEAYKSKVTKEQVEEAKAFFNDKNTEIFPYDKGVRDDEGQFSDKEVVDAANLRMRMILEYNKEIEHEKNGLSDSYLNKEQLVRSYERYKIFEDILLNREEAAYWNEALKENKTELYKLQSFDERYMAKKRLEEKRSKRDKNKADLNKYISYYKKENHELDIENLSALKEGTKEEKNIANEERTSLANIYNNEIRYMKNNVDSSVNVESLTNDYNRHNKLEEIFNNRTDTNYWAGLNNKVNDLSGLLSYDLEYRNEQLQEKRTKQREKENTLDHVLDVMANTTDENLRAKMRFGTKKIESKGEYKQVANAKELINNVKPIKDFHADIKGRAILDMLGIDLPMYSKRNGKLLPGKLLGYSRYKINFLTKEITPTEVGIVAETGSSVQETDTIIHECMHTKIRTIKDNLLNKYTASLDTTESGIAFNVEESLVSMAGFSLSGTIHDREKYKEKIAYASQIANVLPRIWDIKEFKTARKSGINGIGAEVCKQIMAGNKDFIDNIVNTYASNETVEKSKKRKEAIEKAIIDRTDKVDAITNGDKESPIGNLVEELKRGTISLEVALNSAEYREVAAVLITKFLEDEDLDGIDALIAAL